MTARLDNEYQDSDAAGSLVSGMLLWQQLLATGGADAPQRLTFELLCSSESRAQRVAGFLRRNRACESLTVNQVDSPERQHWRIAGFTALQIQSLANVERLFTWLRRAAGSHQVMLERIEFSAVD